MKKKLLYLMGVVLGLPVLVALGLVVWIYTVDTQTLLNKATTVVRDKYQRELTFTAPVSMAVYPNLGIQLGGVSLSEPGDSKQFLQAGKATFSLALMPLLRSEFVVNAVQANDLKVFVHKDKNGRFNFSDFMKPRGATGDDGENKPGSAAALSGFSIESIDLSNANLDYTDASSGTRFQVNSLDLKTGKLESGRPTPVSLGLRFAQTNRHIAVKLASPLTFNLTEQTFELPDLMGQVDIVDPTLPKGELGLPIKGGVKGNLKAQSMSLTLSSAFESTRFNLAANAAGFSSPAIQANLNADQLDLDALFPPKVAGNAGAGSVSAKPVDTPVNLDALRLSNLDLNASIERLVYSNVKLGQVKAHVLGKQGRLTVQPLRANLYGGSMAGSITADANSNAISLNQKLTGVSIEPLMLDLLRKDMLAGKGDVKIDLRMQGKTVNQMKSTTDGTLAIALSDGAVKGFNLGEQLRRVKNLLGAQANQSASSSAAQKTDFSSMRVSFQIVKGVGRSDDLDLMAPLFRVGGQGQFDLTQSQLDYTAKATIVNTSTGQGGKTLDSGLKGLTVPVRIHGPFSHIQWELLLSQVASQAAKDAVKEKFSPQIEEKRQELKDKARDALKGFLQR